MGNTHPKWNFKEFSAFLLLHAANADQKITEEEKNLILEKVSEKDYLQIKEEYDSLTNSEREALILSYKGIYYPTVVQKQEFMAMLLKEFNADGEFSLVELQLMDTLDQLM